jgi:hypothetical protein
MPFCFRNAAKKAPIRTYGSAAWCSTFRTLTLAGSRFQKRHPYRLRRIGITFSRPLAAGVLQ